MASRTAAARGWSALPLVENDSMATRGSTSRSARAFSAVASAISASWARLRRDGAIRKEAGAIRADVLLWRDHQEEARDEGS